MNAQGQVTGINWYAVAMMIFGFIIGAVLAAVFIAFSYIMSDKLQDAKELKNRFGLRVIAELPKVHKKRVWVGFDRLFAQWGGLQTKESDYEQLAKVANLLLPEILRWESLMLCCRI